MKVLQNTQRFQSYFLIGMGEINHLIQTQSLVEIQPLGNNTPTKIHSYDYLRRIRKLPKSASIFS